MRWIVLVVGLATPTFVCAQDSERKPDGNRLAYLDEVNPYCPHRDFAKLITPAWVGEKGVEAVVILGIDDMRDPKHYEKFLRPILNRLKKNDGRAPVSIMTNQVNPRDPQLQAWLKEGLSLECHTLDHPCPFFRGGFDKAKETYDDCVDLMHQVPNSRPVAFRMPCCDSMNTPSPRFYAEIFNKKTAKGNYLSIDSSVFNFFSPADKTLPRDLVLDEHGKERFRKYLPADRDFVNTIENYPYPYIIGQHCWEFPCATPSDWQAQHLHKANNPITLRDMKAALDCTVLKQGVFCLVFHPHGWIQNVQIVDLVDHAVEKHGTKVLFLTFKEALERLEKHVLGGRAWRSDGQRIFLLDVDNDGFMDMVEAGPKGVTRRWLPQSKEWLSSQFPERLRGGFGDEAHFGVLTRNGHASLVSRSASPPMGIDRIYQGTWHFADANWVKDEEASPTTLVMNAEQHSTSFILRDIDGDGVCEMISGAGAVHSFQPDKGWNGRPFKFPVPWQNRLLDLAHPGFMLQDLNGDGKLDVVFSNEKEYGVYVFTDLRKGWTRIAAGKAGERHALPFVSCNRTNNGCWVHSGSLWWANEDTAILKNHVDRRSFKALLERP